MRDWEEGEHLEIVDCELIRNVDDVLVDIVGLRLAWVQPERVAFALAELLAGCSQNEVRSESEHFLPVLPTNQLDPACNVPPLVAPTHLDLAVLQEGRHVSLSSFTTSFPPSHLV